MVRDQKLMLCKEEKIDEHFIDALRGPLNRDQADIFTGHDINGHVEEKRIGLILFLLDA